MGIASRLFDSVEGIYWFPILALAIFVIFFVVIAIHTFGMKKSKEEECGELPFEHGEKHQSHKV